MRHPTPEPPAEIGVHEGLAYATWLPEREAAGGVVILHGAGSCKESHFDFGRAARASGLAALAFDLRGHGSSPGRLDGRAVRDVAAMVGRLRATAGRDDLPMALRGSSMGGWLALVSAEAVGAAAVVAICPAASEHLLRGLRAGDWEFEADVPELENLLAEHDPMRAVTTLEAPLLLLHAEGDERIPVEHSAALHRAAGMEHKRFIALPGGHHRSIQHDAEMQGESLRFLLKAFRAAANPRGSDPTTRAR